MVSEPKHLEESDGESGQEKRIVPVSELCTSDDVATGFEIHEFVGSSRPSSEKRERHTLWSLYHHILQISIYLHTPGTVLPQHCLATILFMEPGSAAIVLIVGNQLDMNQTEHSWEFS